AAVVLEGPLEAHQLEASVDRLPDGRRAVGPARQPAEDEPQAVADLEQRDAVGVQVTQAHGLDLVRDERVPVAQEPAGGDVVEGVGGRGEASRAVGEGEGVLDAQDARAAAVGGYAG